MAGAFEWGTVRRLSLPNVGFLGNVKRRLKC